MEVIFILILLVVILLGGLVILGMLFVRSQGQIGVLKKSLDEKDKDYTAQGEVMKKTAHIKKEARNEKQKLAQTEDEDLCDRANGLFSGSKRMPDNKLS